MSRARLLAVVVALTLLAAAGVARAHQLGRSYCNVLTVPGGIDVSVETAVEHLGLGGASDAEIRAKHAEIEAAVARSISAKTPSGACSARVAPLELVTRDGGRAVRVTLAFSCPAGPVELHNGFRLDVDPVSEIVCSLDGTPWAFRAGAEDRDVGTPPTLGSVLGSFVRLGAHHVAGGIDHVLFVIALLVAAARASKDHSLARGLRAMAAVVTGFTLGHSVTLIAAGLDLIRLEPRVTESVIALSIVVVSLENVLRSEIRWRWLTALLFGLVHGFGFASVLAQTELPRRGAVLALLAFNVGIELAQLAIVIVVFPPLGLAARRRWYEHKLLRPVSLCVAGLASVWLLKRAAGLHFLPWLGS